MHLQCTVLLIFFANTALGYKYLNEKQKCSKPNKKITGGIIQNTGSAFPYLVSLRYRNVHFCGSSILNEKFILTAAHCVYKKCNSLLSIQFGESHINPKGSHVIQVNNVTIHDQYDNNTFHNDIALLKLKSNIIYGATAFPVVLPYQCEKIPKHTKEMYIMGWDQMYSPKMNSVQYTKIQSIFSNIYCSRQEPVFNSLYQFCGAIRGAEYDNHNLCHVDSGGPVIIKGKQFGIFSWSSNPCSEGHKNIVVFTRVPTYRIWINQNTGI